MKRLSVITVFLFAVLSCVKDPAGKRIQPGESLPAFSVTTLEGKTVSTSDLLGKPSVVVFFSTTCPDCHRQLPEIESVWLAADGNVNVLAIARDEDRGTVSTFWSKKGFTMPCAAPGNRRIYDLFDRGSRSGVPLTFVADPEGTVLLVSDDTKVLSSQEILSITFDSKNR